MSSSIDQADRSALRARLLAQLPASWITRFAPAPTGALHLGHAVNAVYVWSMARAFGGRIVLRIEDHDRIRSTLAWEEGILRELQWLGLHADNGELGLDAPDRQSARPQRYADAMHALVGAGQVYPCRCSRKEIATQDTSAGELRYPGTCRTAGVAEDETPARRMLIHSSRAVQFNDLRHGAQHQTPAHQCGDVLIRDRRADWTYQFAVVVDDLAQGVDVIIRGDDLLSSTGRQLLIRDQLGSATIPLFLHHPLVIRDDGTKLSKSRGDSGIADLRNAGWTAAQVLGHAAFLGGLQQFDAPILARDLPLLWAAAA
jgi:glutamyl-Q tRNA(Asp) synthetase